MPLPTALTAPVSALSPRQRSVFFWLTIAGLGLVLFSAEQMRAAWPRWPVADPDTWGYLHPALSKLLGGPFAHTYGRNFVYPGFLYLLLRATGDFGVIPLAQHALGLATGGLLWIAWRQWRGWFGASSRLPAWADATLGLGLVAFYLREGSVLHFEMQIRPEALFPVAAAGQLCLLLAFCRTWWGGVRRPARAAFFAGASLFAAALAYQLKPSFGLAAAVAALPVAWAVVFPWRRQERRPRLLLVGAAAAAGLATVVLFTVPERRLSFGDPMARIFLPETLLTVHATVVRDQMLADQRSHAPTPYADWLPEAAPRLDREVQRAAEADQRPYPTLGINPDHLMYGEDSFCRWLYDTHIRRQLVAFCYYYYERAWTHHPGAMLANVGRQLRVFYAWRCPAFWTTQKLKLERFYTKTDEAFSPPAYRAQMLTYPPAAAYLAAADRFSGSTVVFRASTAAVRVVIAAAWGFLPLLGLFLAGMIAARFLPAARRRTLWASGAVLLLMEALLFGNCLTVAVVHSFDIGRYSLNLLLYAVLCELAAAVWLYEFAWAWVGNKPTAVPAAVPSSTIPFAGPDTPAHPA